VALYRELIVSSGMMSYFLFENNKSKLSFLIFFLRDIFHFVY